MPIFKKLTSFAREREGNIMVEFAFLASILAVMLMGVIDFGLAYAREMAMSNAVRAGTQFALVRRPSIGPTPIPRRPWSARPTFAPPWCRPPISSPATRALRRWRSTSFLRVRRRLHPPCLSTDSTPLSCTVRTTLLSVTLTLPTSWLSPFPVSAVSSP